MAPRVVSLQCKARTLLEVKRTLRERRERVDPTRNDLSAASNCRSSCCCGAASHYVLWRLANDL